MNHLSRDVVDPNRLPGLQINVPAGFPVALFTALIWRPDCIRFVNRLTRPAASHAITRSCAPDDGSPSRLRKHPPQRQSPNAGVRRSAEPRLSGAARLVHQKALSLLLSQVVRDHLRVGLVSSVDRKEVGR